MKNLSILLLLLLSVCSCNDHTNKPTGSGNLSRTDSVSVSTLDSVCLDVDFRVKKLSDTAYVLYYDTLFIKEPFVKIYQASFHDKEALAILSRKMPMEDSGGYSEDLLFYLINKNGTVVYNQFDGYTVSENTLIVDNYELKESPLKFKAYDRFYYQLKFCAENNMLRYNYGYDFRITSSGSNSIYEKVFKSDLFRKITLGTDYKETLTFKHSIREDVLNGLSEDEACYNYGNSSYIEPIFMDSVIFVVQELSNSYMGGAHGTYATDYYNFEVKTGEIISLEDLIDTDDDRVSNFLISKIEDYLYNEYGDISYSVDKDSLAYLNSFYMRADGIVLVFAMYALGGGAWEKHVFISFEDLKPYLKMNPYSA